MIRHMLINGPWHDLQKIPIERRDCREAVCSYGHRAVWMKMIKIFAGPEDFQEFRKRVIPLRQSGLCRRRQVSGNNVRRRGPRYRAEIPSSAQVGCRINRLRLAKVWVSSSDEFSSWAGAVTAIAVALCVDNIAGC